MSVFEIRSSIWIAVFCRSWSLSALQHDRALARCSRVGRLAVSLSQGGTIGVPGAHVVVGKSRCGSTHVPPSLSPSLHNIHSVSAGFYHVFIKISGDLTPLHISRYA